MFNLLLKEIHKNTNSSKNTQIPLPDFEISDFLRLIEEIQQSLKKLSHSVIGTSYAIVNIKNKLNVIESVLKKQRDISVKSQ